jgi:hypothetical protein
VPLTSPVIDDRRFAELVDETLARVRVHTPEWTNFNHSDPGVTLVQLFAFLTENLLYRANLTPERHRTKFLQLLRVPLAPATAASGLVAIRNERGPAAVQALPGDLEVRAGDVPFRTQFGLDVLPIEARVFFKQGVPETPELRAYYELLYASYQTQIPDQVQLYRTAALDPKVIDSVDLQDTVDGALWIALLVRRGDEVAEVRRLIGGRTLMLGVVPALDADSARLVPGGQAQAGSLLRFDIPAIPLSGRVERDGNDRPDPRYRALDPRTEVDLLSGPGVAQLALPAAQELVLWADVDPLEAGVGDMPPSLEDPTLADRLLTWLRVRADGSARARLKWAGINVVPVRQIERVVAEPLADGDGTPDQERRLARAPVLAGSVAVTTRAGNDQPQLWKPIDDLAAAPPEVPVADPRRPPGAAYQDLAGGRESTRTAPEEVNVFELDAEAGVLRFGDGLHGRRLPLGARVFASYEYSEGAEGNVAEGAISGSPQLPSGFVVANPVRTWGGADAETVEAGEKQVRRYLQHRDRLVSADDIESIACRTPGVEIGRIEVLPAFHPDLDGVEPGAAPGVVTLLAIPRFDPRQPDAPQADRLFLATLCRYLDPRRLVTTELVVRGPRYRGIWISVGVEVAAGLSIPEVIEDVKARLRDVLAPIGPAGCRPRDTPLFTPRGAADRQRGWPLRTPVESRVLLAEVARVPGVTSVADVLLAEGNRAAGDVVEMTGLDLPRVLGLSVVAGEAVPIDALRGGGEAAEPPPRRLLPVPVVPETC